MGKTFAEKILSLKSGRDVSAGDIVIVTPDYCLSHENAASVSQTFSKLAQRVWDPSRIVITIDTRFRLRRRAMPTFMLKSAAL